MLLPPNAMILFADGEIGWIVGIGGVVTAIVSAIVTIMKAVSDARVHRANLDAQTRAQKAELAAKEKEQTAVLLAKQKEQEVALEAQRVALKAQEQQSAINQWKLYADTQQKEYLTLVDNLQKQNNQQAMQIDDLRKNQNSHALEAQQKHQECLQRETELRTELRLVEIDMRRLKALTGSFEPAVVSAALIIADLSGIIREASPAVGPILHWMRQELIGKPLLVLVPERLHEKHLAAFSRFAGDGGKLLQGANVTTIKTFALTSQGDEIPVSITITPWKQGSETMISAEISRRPGGVLATQEQMEQIADKKPI